MTTWRQISGHLPYISCRKRTSGRGRERIRAIDRDATMMRLDESCSPEIYGGEGDTHFKLTGYPFDARARRNAGFPNTG